MSNSDESKNSQISLFATSDIEALMDEYVSKLEERVAIETQNFQLMADAMPQIVWTTLPDGTADYYNKRWYEYSGFSKEKTFSYSGWKVMKSIMPLEDRKIVIDRWKHSLKTGELFEAEFRLRDQSGNYRWHLGRALPGYNSKGKIVKWFGTSTDIDEHKRSQEQKDEFIAIASHELKTPVTSIKIFSQMIQRHVQQEGNKELEEKVGKVNNQLDKLTVLINDLLDVSKIDTGRLELNRTNVDVDLFLSKLVNDQQLVNDAHTIKIKGKAKTELLVDENRLEQALVNFISNAVKYSPDSDSIIIHVERNENEVVIGVQDFGIGIARHELKRVFSRFFRVTGTRQETFPGMGLGLYISAEIIEREGGRAWVESEPGKGSTFYVALPVHKRKELRSKKKEEH